ncbi:MAG: F0F1 ATP synthase subunit alpha, partial [Planctomycetia bacterium]|nr:F0F1 ATP synthase subunit alpha [Planctomycetia bacterium]
GALDKVPRNQVAAWEKQFLLFMKEQRAEVRNTLLQERKLTKDIEAKLLAAIQDFQPQFKPA